jgi:hypothetical protein
MPMRLAQALKQVLTALHATADNRAIMFEDFKANVLVLCPKQKESSLKQLVYNTPPPWLRKKGPRGSYAFWALPANAEEPPPAAQLLAKEAPPAAALLPPAAPPAASLGDFSNGGPQTPPCPRLPPAPSAGRRRPIGQQPGRLRKRATVERPRAPPRAGRWGGRAFFLAGGRRRRPAAAARQPRRADGRCTGGQRAGGQLAPGPCRRRGGAQQQAAPEPQRARGQRGGTAG